MSALRRAWLPIAGAAVVAMGCGKVDNGPFADSPADGADSDGGASNSSGASTGPTGGGPTSANSGGPASGGVGVGSLFGDAATPGATTTVDPQTCDQAAQAHSYIGCDYWPTVLANTVWDIFDFAVVVANAGQGTANVTVTGPSGTNQTASVPSGQLAKIYLPWVPALKGPSANTCGDSPPVSSVLQAGGAFHLVSTAPVTVYQFNALEYQPKGGPLGKDWSSCPGYMQCMDMTSPNYGSTAGCYSFSNDASLLLPSTAMTGNYRVAGHEGVVVAGQAQTLDATMTITGTRAGTTVHVKVSSGGRIGAGTGIEETSGGGTLTLTLGAGDVAELVAAGGSDLSGSLVQASAPIQVITGHPCIQVPPTQPSCDHIEESVFPAETLGKHYVVTGPAGPGGDAVGHQVRFYGNFDGTHLTYDPPAPPAGCPTTLDAGQVVECGVPACPPTVDLSQMSNCGITLQDFEVRGDQPFAVGTFTLGSWVVDTTGSEGDPAQSFPTAVEQYRTKYVFLAPDDYSQSFVNIVAHPGTAVAVDGQPVTAVPHAVGGGAFVVYRQKLGVGRAGAHTLSASDRVGIQVIGYGTATSYMVPGGLDLANIAPPPVR
ncbi:MAG TPA: IgGFc-binding protein [Polyangiaceae bacterium]|nr:IgGFc-binding protein [Polyangiaceae bacterium]